MSKEEIMFPLLAEGGSIEIVKTQKEGTQCFLLKTSEHYDDENCASSAKEFRTFLQAFEALDKKYPWYYLHLDFVDERYKEILRVKLVEHRQKSRIDEERWKCAERRFEEVLQ